MKEAMAAVNPARRGKPVTVRQRRRRMLTSSTAVVSSAGTCPCGDRSVCRKGLVAVEGRESSVSWLLSLIAPQGYGDSPSVLQLALHLSDHTPGSTPSGARPSPLRHDDDGHERRQHLSDRR